MSRASTVDQTPPDERTGEQWSGVLSGPVSTAGDRKRKSRGRVPPETQSLSSAHLETASPPPNCGECNAMVHAFQDNPASERRHVQASMRVRHSTRHVPTPCPARHAVPRRSRSRFPRFPDPLGGPDRDPTSPGNGSEPEPGQTGQQNSGPHVTFRSGAPPARPHPLRCLLGRSTNSASVLSVCQNGSRKNPSSQFFVGFLGRASDP